MPLPHYRGSAVSDLKSNKEWLPVHYVVSVSGKRREAMIRKLTRLGVNYNLVDAYTPSDDIIINHYGRGRDLNGKWGCGSTMSGVVACMASHFKALKTFLASTDEIAVILEDDVIFHKEYKSRLRNLIDLFISEPTFPNVITYMRSNEPNHIIISNNIHKTWFTMGYIITRSYAEYVLENYDRPHIEVSEIIKSDKIPTILDKHGASSELITMKSGGLVCNIPLVIEDRPNNPSLVGNKQYSMQQFGLHNYVADS